MPNVQNEFDPGDMLRRFGAALDNPTDILNAIGGMLESRAKMAFQKQGRGPSKWAERAVPNIPGIIADLKAGKRPPARRFDSRPAGVDTGRLLADISHQIIGKDVVQVGSMLPYAGTIQSGGEVDIPVTKAVKDALGKYLDSLDRTASKAEKTAFGVGPKSGDFKGMSAAQGKAGLARKAMSYLLNPKVTSITWNVTARPFVGVYPEDMDDIRRLIFEGLVDPRKRVAA